MTKTRSSEALKEYVREKYSEIAKQSKQQNEQSCCGATSSCGDSEYTIFSDSYEEQKGYFEDADLGLGCGIPTEGADVKTGDTVLDLGSGAGNDCFVARSMVGEEGKVIGIDFSREMVDKAIANRDKLGYENVVFHEGDIENMPLEQGTIDVILSNCVLNLVPDKAKAFKEMNRVLKPGGHFSVSDIVIQGELPDRLLEEATLYAGCVSGALKEEDYMKEIHQAGFEAVNIVKRKAIELPDSLLSSFLNPDEMEDFKNGEVGVHSITVQGVKSEN